MTTVNTIIAMNDDLKAKCEKTFYSELYHFEETSQGLLIDETTGQIYLKKTLDTYDKDVYGWLKANKTCIFRLYTASGKRTGSLLSLKSIYRVKHLMPFFLRGCSTSRKRYA